MARQPVYAQKGTLIILGLVIFWGMFAWHKYADDRSVDVFTQKKLMSETRLDKITCLKELGAAEFEYAYLLTNYQTYVDPAFPKADQVNEYLQSIKYCGPGEGEGDIILAQEQYIRVISANKKGEIVQDNYASMLAPYQVNDRIRAKLPANFESSGWADAEHAAFYRLEHNGRQQLVFGRAQGTAVSP